MLIIKISIQRYNAKSTNWPWRFTFKIIEKLKERGKNIHICIYTGSLCFDFSVVQCSVYVEVERDIY